METLMMGEEVGRLRDRVEKAEAAVGRVEALADQVVQKGWTALYVEEVRDALRGENADRESERADLRDRVEKAEAAVARVEALRDQWERVGGFLPASQLARLDAALRGDQ